MKGIVKFFIVIILICLAGYLTFSLLSQNIAQKNDVQSFCTQKCNYNPSSLFWEFSGDSGVKGFTTKDECFVYCGKVKMGFTASILNSVWNIFNK